MVINFLFRFLGIELKLKHLRQSRFEPSSFKLILLMNPFKGEVGSSFELSWDMNTKKDPCLFNTCSEVQTCEPDASERGYKCNCNDLTFNGWGDNGPQVKTIKMIEQLIEDHSTKAFSNRTICVPLHQSFDNPTGIQLKTSKDSSITDDVFPYAIIYEFFKVKIWLQFI